MNRKQGGWTLMEGGVLLYLGLLIAAAVGWVMNVVAICHADFGHLTGMLVLRIVGVFIAPLGAVLGFI